MSSILRSSKFVRYFAGLARGILISNQQDIDRSLLQKSQHLVGVFSSNSLSSTNFRINSTFDRTLKQLDEVARKTGRISLKEVEEAFNELRHLKTLTTSQSLMVIRCCGNLVPEETPQQRTQLVEEIWKTFEKLGVSLDISHYNALLKVYLENEHKFSPTEFLAKLEKQGIEPNRVTYQRLIAGYCQLGDIAGATTILEFMKDKQLPVSEGVFNALILGHSRANDMESAEGILAVMKQASLDPSNETYCTLISGYAERGDQAAIERLINDCKVKDVFLSDKDFLEIAYAAAISGQDKLLDGILKNIRIMVGYNQDAANVLLRLITAGKDDAAYKVFQTMTPSVRTEPTPNMSGHLIVKQLVNTDRPAEKILSWCDKLEKDGHTKYGLMIALETSFTHGNVDLTLDLLRVMKDKQEPIRNHYFWPSMVTLGKRGHSKRLLDILRIMTSEFRLAPNVDTLLDYYFPYAEEKSHQETVKDLLEAGVSRRQAVLGLFYRLLSNNKLKEALKLAVQHSGVNFRSQLLNRTLLEALQQTGDVKTIVALTHIITCSQLLEVEEDEESTGAVDDVSGRFLIGVVSSAQTRQMVTQVLKEMVNCGLSISNSCAELVESRLPGNQLTTEISDLLAKMTSGDLTLALPQKSPQEFVAPFKSISYLERAKEQIKTNNMDQDNLIPIVRSLFHAYCEEGDLTNALKVKQEWVEDLKQELTIGWWTKLMGLYCSKENLEEAKQCFQKIKELSPVVEIDSGKILKLVKLYVENNLLDEAIVLLKECKPRNEMNFMSRTSAWQVLHAVADITKDPELVKKVLNILVDGKYVEINNVMLGPIIKAHILRDDLEGALKEFDHCVQKYRATPWKNELSTRFIEKEDATNLQKLVDLSTQVHGEINSLYDLVLSFVECGRIRQARKILETPGLNSRYNRLQYACERYVKEGMSAPLEGLVQITKDLTHIDRSEIYYNLLETYCKADNVDKAYGLWTQMQDEDVHVSDEFLMKLGNFLKSKGVEVPFVIPEPVVKSEEVARKNNKLTKQNGSENLLLAIKAMNVNEALKIKNKLQNNGTRLSKIEVVRLMELLVEKNQLKEAISLFSSYESYGYPLRILNFLISKLSQYGELDMLAEVGGLLNEEMKKKTSFVNKYLNCAVAAGKGKEELNKLEREIDASTTPEEIDELTNQFPRGGIFGILESSPSYHDQVATIAEKYFKKGSVSPANCLCMFYLADGQTEKAKEIYQSFNLANASRIMFKNVLKKARKTSNPKLLEELISLIGNSVAFTTDVKSIIYSNIINIYVQNGNFEEALPKLEESLKHVPIESIYHSTLVKLKDGLESKNIPFKYTIPEKQLKEQSSSSSSSSSDVESKKSIRAKQ